MVKHRRRSNDASMAEFVTDYLEQRDEDVMQALLAAGMFVACADGRVKRVDAMNWWTSSIARVSRQTAQGATSPMRWPL